MHSLCFTDSLYSPLGFKTGLRKSTSNITIAMFMLYTVYAPPVCRWGGNQHWQSKEWANGLTESRWQKLPVLSLGYSLSMRFCLVFFPPAVTYDNWWFRCYSSSMFGEKRFTCIHLNPAQTWLVDGTPKLQANCKIAIDVLPWPIISPVSLLLLDLTN